MPSYFPSQRLCVKPYCIYRKVPNVRRKEPRCGLDPHYAIKFVNIIFIIIGIDASDPVSFGQSIYNCCVGLILAHRNDKSVEK